MILASKVTGGEAKEIQNTQQKLGSLAWVFIASFCIGCGWYLGMNTAKWVVGLCRRPFSQVKGVEPSNKPSGWGSTPGSLEEGMQQPLLGSQQAEFSVSTANAGEEQAITGSQENQMCYEDFVDDAARRDETPGSAALPYQPTYEDLLAAYPYAMTGCERLQQQLQDSEGEVLMLEQKLHDGEQALENLRGRLRNSERFGQEYVERCNYLQQTVREKAREIEQFEELIRTMRRENEELQTQLLREGDSREALNSVMPHARRLTHREVRQAYMHVQHFIETEARGQPVVRDPTVQEPPPELVMRHADDEVWLVPVHPVAQPDQEEEEEGSEIERATTSSGEYTIRERSSDSSGGYAPELGTGSPAPRGENPASSVSGGGASMLLSAATHAASISSVDSTAGKEDACYEPDDDFASCKGDVWWWFLVGCLFGILIGATVNMDKPVLPEVYPGRQETSAGNHHEHHWSR